MDFNMRNDGSDVIKSLYGFLYIYNLVGCYSENFDGYIECLLNSLRCIKLFN